MRNDLLIINLIAVYLIIAFIGFSITNLQSMNYISFLYAIAFTLSIFLGYRYVNKLKLNKTKRMYLYGILGVLMGFTLGPIGIIIPISILIIGLMILKEDISGFKLKKNYLNPDNLYKIGILLIILLFLIPITKGIIPILNHSTRTHILIKVFNLTSILTVILLAYKPNFKVFLLGETISIISTYRSFGIIIFAAYLLRSKKKKKKLIIGSILVATIFILRFLITKDTYSVWNFGIITSFIHRISFTYGVFEKLHTIGIPFGSDHLLIFDPDLRLYVGSLFQRSVDYTFTLFGQPVHDFGIFGLLEGLLLGMSLKDSEKDKMMEVINLTFFIIIIEVGLDAMSFGILMGTAFFALKKSNIKKSYFIRKIKK